jgi:RNA polymerase sigma factor (sigma-70 family)
VPAPTQPDALVTAALAAGDHEQALRLLMRAHSVAVYRFCRAMVGDAHVDDVHQLTFVHAYRGLSSFRGGSSARAWLFGIARHRCLDVLRQQRRQAPSADDLRPSAESGLESALADRDVLEKCIARLKPSAREAVLLRHHHELSYREMAEVLAEDPATLQARVARALPLLRKCIERRGGP